MLLYPTACNSNRRILLKKMNVHCYWQPVTNALHCQQICYQLNKQTIYTVPKWTNKLGCITALVPIWTESHPKVHANQDILTTFYHTVQISTQSLQKPGNLTIRTKCQPTQVLLRYRWTEVADSWQEQQQLVYNCSSRWSAVAAGCSMPSNHSSQNSRSRADTLRRVGNSSHCSSRSLEVDNLVASLASLQVRRIPLKVQATLNYRLH